MIVANNFANPNPKSDNSFCESCAALLERLSCQNRDDGISFLEHPSSLLTDNQDDGISFLEHPSSLLTDNQDDGISFLEHPSSLLPDNLIWQDKKGDDSDNSFLTDLKLSCDFVIPTDIFRWTKLKSLSLSDKSDLDNKSLAIILSRTPRLETFELHECYGFTRINMRTSMCLKNFVISGHEWRVHTYVDLIAPYIESLKVVGALTLVSLYLNDVSSLVEAKFSYHAEENNYLPYTEYDERNDLRRHMRRLRRVKKGQVKLRLGERCLEILSLLKDEGFVPPSNIILVDDEEFD